MAAGTKVAKKKVTANSVANSQKSMVDQISGASKELFSPKKTATLDSNIVAAKSKQERKRAADYLSDEEGGATLPVTTVAQRPENEAPPRKKSKKDAKAGKAKDEVNNISDGPVSKAQLASAFGEPEKPSKKARKARKENLSLTADGINGVLEQPNTENVETITPKKTKKSKSMQAEAQRTTEKEIEDEFGSGDEQEDLGGALLVGFDSDGEDDAVDKGFDSSKPLPELQLSRKKQKKLSKALADGEADGPGTVYVGRIPHGFYEREMREYFSQFGPISKLRLSRNKITGASKHFAFVEFKSDEVAKIVAETMDNYLMFGHILKCKYAPAASLHPDVWKGANKRFKKVPHNKIEKRKLEAPKTKDQWDEKIGKEQKKREEKAKKMEEIGYDLKLPRMKTIEEVLAGRKVAKAEQAKAVEDEPTTTEYAAVVEASSIVVDSGALVKPKKSKKVKKDKHAVERDSSSATANQPTTAPVPNQEPAKTKGAKKQKEDQNAGNTTQQPESVKNTNHAANESSNIDNVKSEKKHKQEEQTAVDKQLDTQLKETLQEASTEVSAVGVVAVPFEAFPSEPEENADTAKADGGKSRKQRAKKNKNKGSLQPQSEIATTAVKETEPTKTKKLEKSKKRNAELDDGSKAVVKKHKPNEQKADKNRTAKIQNTA